MKLKSFNCIIGLLIIFLNSIALSEEKIDIWKNKKEATTTLPNTENQEKQNKLIITPSDTIGSLKKIEIQETSEIQSDEQKVYGIFEPANYDLNLNMWSSTKAEDFRSSLKRLNKIDTIEQKNPVLSTLGLAHLELKQYDLAEKYFTEHLELAKSVDNKGLSYDLLGKLYLKLKRYDQALSCFKEAFNIYKNLSSMQTNHNIIKNIALTYEKKGDKNKSLMFYKKYVKQLEKNNKEKFKLSKINQKKIIQGLESEFENKKNESHLKSSTQLLSITHNEILYEVIKNLESDSYNKNKLIQHIKNKIDTKIDWTDFLIAYENLNPEFFLAINKYKLSMTELKVCIYIKNGFDNYQIAGIMNITLRAVQQNRYRIKKKLDINQKLDSFILSI